MWFAKKSTHHQHYHHHHQQQQQQEEKLSALIDRLNKPLPPIIGSQNNAETLVIVVSGRSNVGKSTFIRFGLQNLIAKHDSNRPDLQCHHTNILFDKTNYPIDLIEVDGSNIANHNFPVIHAAIVCYDTTDRDSLDCIPDLLDFYLSRHIPTHVVGLKADLSSETRQIDPNLVQQIVELFALDHFTVDAFSEQGLLQMQNVYQSILRIYHPTVVNNDKAAEKKEEIKSSSFFQGDHSPGFIYAPTTSASSKPAETTDIGTTLVSDNKRATANTSSYYAFLATRRGSKDSSESFGIGLTAEDVVDRLLSTDYNKQDENGIPIFLTFFRKFMKPYELVKMLVERFDNDGLASHASCPTELQKRIHSIFSLWLSHYWNDFYGPHARKHIILFLDRISKYEYLTPICDSLAPLVVREPPSGDPDKHWGLVDDEDDVCIESLDDTTRLSWPTTPITTRKRKEKKDSAYASGTFSVSSYSHHQPTSSSPLSSPQNEHFQLKRLSNKPNPQQISSSSAESPNPNRALFRNSTSRRIVTHAESHPNLKSSYAAKGSSSASNNSDSCGLPRRAEFAGGLINIDHVATSNYPSSFKITPSIASTRTGVGAWTSSLGAQLLASSFICSLRQHRSDKDQSCYNYKVFMRATDLTIADQLTWIEAELFARIKPREFIRNIWTSSVQYDGSSCLPASGSSNAVTASIAHFNFISAWVVTMIVTQTRLTKRVAVLEKFMSIAVALRNHNNYNSLMAILAGINSASVLRLKKTRQAVCTKKVFKRFQSLERLMSTDRSFSSYRMALKATGSPGIPYLGIHNQDLVSLAEANKDFRADGTIHWEKFRLMGETIMATMKFKYSSYSIEPDLRILTFIADSCILSEDEQYKRSTSIEPRLASSSTNTLRSLWLKM